MSDHSPRAQSCPVCGETAEWMEELAGRYEYGCVNNHTWLEEKESATSD